MMLGQIRMPAYEGTPGKPGTGWFDRAGIERPKHGLVGEGKYEGKPFSIVTGPCSRCGGAGGSDKWAHTGWTCYDCGGKGSGRQRQERLYTADELKLLDERRTTARAKKAARVAEAARIKREAEDAARGARKSLLEADPFYVEFKALMGSFTPADEDFQDEYGNDCVRRGANPAPSFLVEMFARIEHTDLSDKQQAAVEKFIQSRKDRIRKAENSRYLGEVGKRVAISGKVVFQKVVRYGEGYMEKDKHIIKIETDDEQTLVWFTSNWHPVGTRLKGKATIKENKEYQGKKESVVTNLRATEIVSPKEEESA